MINDSSTITTFLFDELLNCGFLIQIRVLTNAIKKKKNINPVENRFIRQALIEGTNNLGILYLLRTVCCPVFHLQISHRYVKIRSLPINRYYLRKKRKNIRNLCRKGETNCNVPAPSVVVWIVNPDLSLSAMFLACRSIRGAPPASLETIQEAGRRDRRCHREQFECCTLSIAW